MKNRRKYVCLCVVSPVNSFLVVVGVKKLDFLISLWAGEITGDGGMHEQEEIKCCRSWKKGHNS